MTAPDMLEIHGFGEHPSGVSCEYLLVVDRTNGLMLKFDGEAAALSIAEGFVLEGNEEPDDFEVAERMSDVLCGVYLHQVQGDMEAIQPLDAGLLTDTSLICTVQVNQHTLH